METKYIVVIEIGSSKIRGALAEQKENGSLLVNEIHSESLVNCVRYGIIQNVGNVRIAISKMIKQFETSIDGIIEGVYVGINGRTVHNVPVLETRPLGIDSSITDSMLQDLKNEAKNNHKMELDNLDVLPISYFVDGIEVDNPVGSIGAELRAEMNLVVARTNLRLNAQRVFNELNYKVKKFCVTPISAGKVLLSKEERSLGVMLLDLGAETTTISIYKNDALRFICCLPIGGRNITRDITALNVLEDTAERIKQSMSNPLDPKSANETIEGVKGSEVASYIVARTGEIIANIKQQRENAKDFVETIKSVVVLGGGSLLRGLTQKLNEELNVSVRVAKTPNSIQSYSPMATSTENLNLISLIVDCASLNDSSCAKKNEYDFHTEGTTVKEPEPTPVDEGNTGPKPTKKKKGFLSGLKGRLVDALSDDDSEEKKDYFN